MLTKTEIVDIITKIVEEQGCLLYDLIVPYTGKGAVRVFIQNSDERSINHDDCSKVSKAIHALVELDWLFEMYSLEVSSPGVNRSLKSVQHYHGAIGERVKLYLNETEANGTNILTGVIKNVEDGNLSFLPEGQNEMLSFNIMNIKKAQVENLL